MVNIKAIQNKIVLLGKVSCITLGGTKYYYCEGSRPNTLQDRMPNR